jgi:hypothetical protein
MDDVAFCRALLYALSQDFAAVGVEVNVWDGGAWTYNLGHGSWEFHGPNNGSYWHGRAANAYDARYKGWMDWLRKVHPDKYEKLEEV